MKRILLRSGKGPFEVLSPEVTLSKRPNPIGGNVGNSVFSHAAHKLLLRSDTEVDSTHNASSPADAARINNDYDVFVVSLANAFRPTFQRQLAGLTELIEQLKIPCIVLGVGAQAPEYDLDKLGPLNEVISGFLRAILDRSAMVGVRGEFTADYVRTLGFNDVEVIGCPSMFMYGPTFPEIRKTDTIDLNSKIAINASRKPGSRSLGPVMDHHHAKYPNTMYLMQDDWDLELLLWGESRAGVTPNGLPNHVNHPMYQENKVRFFCDPWTWMDYLRDFDFSFGTRIHGNVVGLLAGTPSYVLAHDSRTLELSRYFEIPHRLMADVPEDLDVAELHAEADYGPLLSGHGRRWDTFSGFMAKNGLQHSYSEGGDPAAFEAQVAATEFPRGVEALTAPGNDELIQRLRYLRRGRESMGERLATLEREVKALNKGHSKAYEKMRQRIGALENGNVVNRIKRKVKRG